MWNGYICPWCYQPLEHAYERTCKDWCFGGPEATVGDWHTYMNARFGGYKWIGPSRATVEAAENALDRACGNGIWLPGRG